MDEKKNRRNRIFGALFVAFCAALIISSVVLLYKRGADDSLYIIYITKSQDSSNDFWDAVKKGAETAAKENNAQIEVMMPENETRIDQQNEMILEAVSKRPSAIVVTPASETETLEALKKVKEAGIPLVFVDSYTEEPVADALVSTDNVEAGRKVGERIAQTITDRDVIGVVSHVQGVSTAREREQGLREGLGEHASQIVETVYSNSSAEHGAEVTRQMLQEHPEITYIACMNEDSTVGASRGVAAAGAQHRITLVGFDNALECIQYMEEGKIDALVVQKAFTMGYLGIDNAVRLVKGEAVSYFTDSGSVLVDRDTMYDEQNEEMLFPFYLSQE